MRKALLIIIAVAILGALALVAKKPASTPTGSSSSSSSQSSSRSFKNGTFTGSAAETPYGTVQIRIVVSGGQISDVKFIQMPNGEDRSRQITAMAESPLKTNTISAQSANIEFVSGATSTSFGYKESLQAALDKATGTSFYNLPNQTS
jgi:uncharacterized protein with FMN-binding domain